MQFKRVDDKTIRCLVTEEELAERDIKVEDFIKDREKIRDFMDEMIELAVKEAGYHHTNPLLAVQIMAVPGQGIIFTLEEDKENQETAAVNTAEGEEDKKAGCDIPVVFAFSYLDELIHYSKLLPQRHNLDNVLYKDNRANQYLLIIKRGRTAVEKYKMARNLAYEFGRLYGQGDITEAFIREHFEPIIKKRALQKLRKV